MSGRCLEEEASSSIFKETCSINQHQGASPTLCLLHPKVTLSLISQLLHLPTRQVLIMPVSGHTSSSCSSTLTHTMRMQNTAGQMETMKPTQRSRSFHSEGIPSPPQCRPNGPAPRQGSMAQQPHRSFQMGWPCGVSCPPALPKETACPWPCHKGGSALYPTLPAQLL